MKDTAEATEAMPTTQATQVTQAILESSRLSPLQRRINDFVARHQLAWDLAMAALALAYVALGVVEDRVSVAVYDHWFVPVEIVITLLFVAEFAGRFWASGARVRYLRHHWIDLVALLPAVRLLRVLRAARFLRIAQVARTLEATRLLRLGALVRFLAEVERAGHRIRWIAQHNGVHVFLSFALGIMVVGGGIVWALEGATNRQFQQLGNAMWWAFATMATVGYGDGPHTIAGRIVAGIIMIVGIGCFGLVSATVTTLFIERTHGPQTSANELKAMLVEISQRLSDLERELAQERAKHSGTGSAESMVTSDAAPALALPSEDQSPIPATVPLWVADCEEPSRP
jgi:voltage-gated potassium channel